MSSPLKTINPIFKFHSFFLILIPFSLFLSHGSLITSAQSIAAIIDPNSRIGKEEKIAMEIAVQELNVASNQHNISLHFLTPGKNPVQTASAVEQLIEEKHVQVIIGLHKWREAVLVSEIGNQHGIPVISFAAAAITPPSMPLRWPNLVTMAKNGSEQINCISGIIQSYNWKRVIVIYEDDVYGGGDGKLSLLAESLQKIGSEIEYRLVLPPVSSVINPKSVVRDELLKVLLTVQSRVFIVLESTLSMAIHLFREANEMGLVGRDSAWIITDTIANFLDSVNTSTISSMEGVLGIKNYYSESSDAYRNFHQKFRKIFRSEYPEEDHFDPGFHALRAYDSIKVVVIKNSSTSEDLLDAVMASDFTGLSGIIRFNSGQISERQIYRIVNVIGKRYKELDFWLPEFGFSCSLVGNFSGWNSQKGLLGVVNWPGNLNLNRNPKGWAMPTVQNPMRIGVPGNTTFDKFVKVENIPNSTEKIITGFCIEVFDKVLERLEFDLPYDFIISNGTYNDLITKVYNKTYDAVVGDVTILDNRTNYVEFTQPYAESGLSMIVPVKRKESGWLFMRPFTIEMWVVTAAILIYTMIIVSFMETGTNPEFGGSLNNRIGTAFWFTFSSLFFAHKEKINSNLTRVVVSVWLFLVFILSSSYTASLSSMLTVQRLVPNITNIDFLRTNKLPVGCDGDSFVMDYLQTVLNFNIDNIRKLGSAENYQAQFHAGNIAAAFLELPYEKVFMNKYCKDYIAQAPTYRFGGLGFVFPKGSPLAADFSRAILKISEDGTLKELEEKYFTSSAECSANTTDNATESLSIKSFWGLFVISGAISTVCFLLFLIRLVMSYRRHREVASNNLSPRDNNIWNKAVRLAKYFYDRDRAIKIPVRVPNMSSARVTADCGSLSSRWEYIGTTESLDHSQVSLPAEIEMPETRDSENTR